MPLERRRGMRILTFLAVGAALFCLVMLIRALQDKTPEKRPEPRVASEKGHKQADVEVGQKSPASSGSNGHGIQKHNKNQEPVKSVQTSAKESMASEEDRVLEEQDEKLIQQLDNSLYANLSLACYGSVPGPGSEEIARQDKAREELKVYVDAMERMIERSRGTPERQRSLVEKREQFIVKLGNIQASARKTEGDVEGGIGNIKEYVAFHTATELLSRMNDTKAMDLVIAQLDRCVLDGFNHLKFVYPAEEILEKLPPGPSRHLAISRLVTTLKETEDPETATLCIDPLGALIQDKNVDFIDYLKRVMDEENNDVKKSRIKTQIDKLADRLEHPEKYSD